MSKGEIVSVKISYEFYTEKNEPKLSNAFAVKINLDPDNFDENVVNINKTCKFRKPEDRYYYSMFDNDEKKNYSYIIQLI